MSLVVHLMHFGLAWIVRKRQKRLSLTPGCCCILVAAASVFSVLWFSALRACANGVRNVLRADRAHALESGCCRSHEDAVHIELFHFGCDRLYVSGHMV